MKKKSLPDVDVLIPYEELQAAADSLYVLPKDKGGGLATKAVSASAYRKLALKHYKRDIAGVQVNVCVMCGFGIPSILEVAHLDQDRKNCEIENLATLCPNCHKMHDIGLIPTEVIVKMRDEAPKENWSLRIKDAGAKAAKTKREKTLRSKKSLSAKKAWQTRVAKG
jgi:hypothetical protein